MDQTNASSPPNTYSQPNQIYSLKEITNAAFGITAVGQNAFNELQNYVTQVITTALSTDQGSSPPNNGNYLGITEKKTEWTVSWGPVIYSNANSTEINPNEIVTDNVMAVYYNASQNVYVISIAGTNAVSVYDWMDEDFAVFSMVPWTDISSPPDGITLPSPPPYIALGSATGFNILLDMKNSSGETLIHYLQSIQSDDTPQTLVVTGHSLGAGLATLLGLYLLENQDKWNSAGIFTDLQVLPTASSTPGELQFVSYFNQLAAPLASPPSGNSSPPPGAITSFLYNHIYSEIDAVPNSWMMPIHAPSPPPVSPPSVYIPSLSSLPFLYDQYNPPSATSPPDAIIGSLVAASATGLYGIYYSNKNASPPVYMPTNGYAPVANGTSPNVTSQPFIPDPAYVAPSAIAKTNSIFNYLYLFFNEAVPGLMELKGHYYWQSLFSLGQTPYQSNLTDFGNYLMEIMFQHGTPYFDNEYINMSAFMNEFTAIQSTIPSPPTSAGISVVSVQEMMVRKVIKKHFGNINLEGLIAAIQKKNQENNNK